MPAAWPASLPTRMEQSGFSEGLGDGRLRSPMEAGVVKMRSRFRPARPMGGTMLMSDAQLASFRSFVTDDLAGGTLPFTFPAQSGTGPLVCRFGEQMPSWSWIGPNNWRVSLALEILP